jgi:hypothetical protein
VDLVAICFEFIKNRRRKTVCNQDVRHRNELKVSNDRTLKVSSIGWLKKPERPTGVERRSRDWRTKIRREREGKMYDLKNEMNRLEK